MLSSQGRSILMPSTSTQRKHRNLTNVPRKRAATPAQLARQNTAMLMYASGSSVLAISKALKTDRETIARDLNEEARRREKEFANERRVVVRSQLQTLDTLKNRVMAAITPAAAGAQAPSLEQWHVTAILAIEERRARLMGIDAPKQVHVEVSGGQYAQENPLREMPVGDRVEIMKRALEASKKARAADEAAAMKNVTPTPALAGGS